MSDSAEKQTSKRKLTFTRIRSIAISSYRTFIKTVFTVVVLVALYNVILDFNSNRLIFEKFDVPIALEKRGYTGREIAGRISDQVNLIRNSVTKYVKIYKTVKTGGEEDEIPEFEVPGANISLHVVMSYMRSFFGNPVQRVYGSIVEDDKLYMTVRISGLPSKMFVSNKNSMESMIADAAEHVLMHLEPFSLALYYNQQKKIPELKSMIKAMTQDSLSDNEKVSVRIINSFILTLEGKYEAAAKEAERAVKMSPNHSYALHNYSIALIDVGRLDESIKVMKHLTTVYTDWSTHNNMAYVMMLTKEYGSAIREVKKSVKMYPECENCYDTWGDILFRQQRYDHAILKVQQAMDLSTPASYDYYHHFLGNIYLAADRNEAAKTSYVEAIRSNPDGNYAKKSQLKLEEIKKNEK